MRKYDHTNTNEIVCPHCGYQLSDSWEFDNEGTDECPSCEKPFSYYREVSVTYSTHKEDYEVCPICNEEKVLENVSCYPSLLKHTKHKRLCEDCIRKLKFEVFYKEHGGV